MAPWDSPLSHEVEKQGGKAMRLGVHNGFDLSTRNGYLKAAQVFRENRPRLAHFSPACFPWTQMQNINQRTPSQCEELHEKREHSRKILKNLHKLAELQVDELGGDISGEQPWTAKSWNEKPWAKMTKKGGGRFRVDGCRFGMKNHRTDRLIQKGWGFFSSLRSIQKAIGMTCNHPAAMHDKIEGALTAKTAVYPGLLCKKFVEALMDRNTDSLKMCHMIFHEQHEHCQHVLEHGHNDCAGTYANDGEPVADHGDAVENPSAEDGEAENAEPDVDGLTRQEKAKLKLIHKNLGHPHNAVLQKMLKQADADARLIKAAGELTCDICLRQAQRKPVLPSTTNVPKAKWEVISVDTFWWKHPVKKPDGTDRYVVGVSYLDEATDLHVASIVREESKMPGSVTSDEFRKHFVDDWLKCLPKPKIMRVDTEGCFRVPI